MLGGAFSPAHVRKCVTEFEQAVRDGWVCWAFSNHDVTRHVTRWATDGRDPEAVAKFAISLLVALRGSICLYQGEELGLEEAEIAFEDLRDPYGIRFWPGFKGRDGCRTPMVWEAKEPHAGFSKGRPWLPIPETHLARAVDVQAADEESVLAHYRRMLAFRKRHPALIMGSIEFLDSGGDNILAFLRKEKDEALLCLFNFSAEAIEWQKPDDLAAVQIVGGNGGTVPSEDGALSLKPLSALFCRVDY